MSPERLGIWITFAVAIVALVAGAWFAAAFHFWWSAIGVAISIFAVALSTHTMYLRGKIEAYKEILNAGL